MKNIDLSKKRLWIMAGLVLLAMALFAIFTPKSANKPATNIEKAKATLAVETVQPQQENWAVSITINGAMSAWQEAQLSAEIGGLRIKQVLVDVGSTVKRGQTLALLADEAVLADLHKQQATVARDRASLAEAKANADRAREIKDSGALSSQQITQYLIAEETAQANLNLSLAELENQQIRLRQTHVLAADDGIISSRTANLGNVVTAGGELFRLIRQGRIEWRAEVNAAQLAKIKIGQKVSITLPDQRTISGTVRIKAPTLDVNTRNALVYIDLPNGAAEPGMYAQGMINLGTQPALAIPQTAVVLRDGLSYVFEVLTATDTSQQAVHRVIQRNIKTGRREGNLVEVISGISSQSNLVLTGGAFLNDGDSVTVTQYAAEKNSEKNAHLNNGDSR